MLLDAGIMVGIVTGRDSKALRHRCNNLGISHIFDAVADKATLLETILKQTDITAEQAAFVGDDLPDLKIMKKVGFSVAVANAHEIVQETANMVTSANGGSGAVREICEAILKAKGIWEKTLERFV
jgi:3-deoxy-D-manno-octulosonate 8-phosphate phosphatase (KDO 8-P phosphatase)